MVSLLYKDILLQKKILLFALGYGVFLLVAFNNPIFSNFIYYMGTVAVSYMMFMTAVSLDERNKSDIMLVSLPIKRNKIILEKYLLVFLTGLIGIALMGSLGGLVKISGFLPISRFVNLNDVFLSLASVLLLSSFYYPLYLKLGYKYSRIINMFFFMLFFFIPSWVTEYITSNEDITVIKTIEKLSTTPTILISVSFFAIALILALISYLISVRIYINKEF